MDFVYDKPIFTQWTFAPAEPNVTCPDDKKGDACRARAEKEEKYLIKNSIASIKHILRKNAKVLTLLKNLNNGKYNTLDERQKRNYVNEIANEIFQGFSGNAKVINSVSVENALRAHTFITTSGTNAAKKKPKKKPKKPKKKPKKHHH
tara:strand:+ start:164 stop:607 length:444 start_codon:yes stop_codon:yes gene_type:complete